jgi:hypothetical protein
MLLIPYHGVRCDILLDLADVFSAHHGAVHRSISARHEHHETCQAWAQDMASDGLIDVRRLCTALVVRYFVG